MRTAGISEKQRTFRGLRFPMNPLPPAGRLVVGPQRCTCYRCNPDLYRYHRPNPGTLKPGQHDYYALATHAVAYFTVPVALEHAYLQAGQLYQSYARTAWTQLEREFYFLREILPFRELQRFISRNVLPIAINVFDSLFFICSFRPQMDRKWWRLKVLDLPVGRLERSVLETQGDWAVVRINSHHPYHNIPPNRSLNSVTALHTLLHEMLNAFFDLYGCFNGTTCGGAECRFVSGQNIGNGRSRAWQMLAKAIEQEAPRLLPGFRPRFDRRRMMITESLRGGYLPSTCDPEHVCGDLGLLVRVLQKIRTRDDDDQMLVVVRRWAAGDSVMPLPKRLDRRRTRSEIMLRDVIDF